MNWVSKNKNLLSPIILCLITAAVFFPINHAMVYSHPHNDFHDHIAFARSLGEGGELPEHIAAHPIWQISLVMLHKGFIVSYEQAAVIIQMFFQILLALSLFAVVQKSLRSLSPILLVGLPFILMLASQIMLLAITDSLYYLGYLGINTHHNPTINMLKPFSVILFVYGVGLVNGRQYTWGHYLIAATLVILSTLIKPNLIICLLPALGILLLVRSIYRQPFDFWFALMGLFLPAVGVLAWQFFATYGSGQPGVFLAPLAVMRAFSDYLLIKFLLSIWFPLIVSVFYFKQVRREPAMLLAWITFFFGALYTYLLAEGGDRFMHGNWGWSGEIALFVLFIAAVIFFLQQKSGSKTRLWWVLLLVGLIPHIAAGAIYYFYTLSSGTFV